MEHCRTRGRLLFCFAKLFGRFCSPSNFQLMEKTMYDSFLKDWVHTPDAVHTLIQGGGSFSPPCFSARNTPAHRSDLPYFAPHFVQQKVGRSLRSAVLRLWMTFRGISAVTYKAFNLVSHSSVCSTAIDGLGRIGAETSL